MSKKIEKYICQRRTHRKIVFKYIDEAKDIISLLRRIVARKTVIGKVNRREKEKCDRTSGYWYLK